MCLLCAAPPSLCVEKCECETVIKKGGGTLPLSSYAEESGCLYKL